MPRYEVTILRTERISFAIDADNRDDALTFMWDGDEIASETTETVIESVTEVTAADR